jgi:deoxyribodipyrimidine photolyase-related protein
MTIIFPHQLYKTHPAISKDRPIVLIEEYLYFNQYLFHKKKLVLHRASMQFYYDYLLEKGYQVTYIDAQNPLCDIRLYLTDVAQKGIKEIHYVHATDDWLDRRITAACEKNNLKCMVYDSPNFINTREEINTFFEGRKVALKETVNEEQEKNWLAWSKQQFPKPITFDKN